MSKDFLEMLDSLPAEQKQPFIDHFVQTILGKPTTPLILTKTHTISNDATLDEKIKLTAAIYGIDPERIDREDYLRGEEEIADSKLQVNELIKDYFGLDPRNKDDELVSVGKFLFTTGLANKLTPCEEPDFILEIEGETIGLEHTRLEAEIDKAFMSELHKKYLKDALVLVMTENPSLTGIANITLNTDTPIFEGKALRDFNTKSIKANIESIHRTLANCVISKISGINAKLPSFIRSLTYQASNEVFVLRHNQEYFGRTDFENMVKVAVQKKEKRLMAYKEKREMQSWWLLLVYSEGGFSSGFKVAEDSITCAIESSFDRIFVLNAYNLSCYELFKTDPFLRYNAKKQFRAPRILPI